AFAERASNLERRIRRMASRPRVFSSAVGASAIAAAVFATAAWKSPLPTRTAASSPAEALPSSRAAEPVHEESHSIVASDSRSAERPAVTFKQIVIAARDSNDIVHAARLADTVADLLRNGVAFDSLAAKYHDFAGRERTGIIGPSPLDSLPL